MNGPGLAGSAASADSAQVTSGDVVVTGGTGTLGRLVVTELLAAGRSVRVVSRRPLRAAAGIEGRVADLGTGQGLDAALAGAGAVVHCATSGGADDLPQAQRLVEATRRAGAPHLLYVSIVGVDRIPLGYYRVKHQVEQVVAASGLPWTVLRATQFHELVLRGCRALARSPVMVVPAVPFQPVAASEVAADLAARACGPAAGRAPDLGGPQVLPARQLARDYLTATGRRRAVLPVALPGATFAGFRRGHHLAATPGGRLTFAGWLAAAGPAV